MAVDWHDSIDADGETQRPLGSELHGARRRPQRPTAPYPKSKKPAEKPAAEVLEDQLSELEEWAEENRKDARRDALLFWSLKVPAIFAAASSGVWAHLGWTWPGVICGAIASFCIVVDGIQPRGALRNTHLRAVHEIKMLISKMTSEFRSSAEQHDELVRGLIRDSQAERQRIAAYIRDAETAFRTTDMNQPRRGRLR
jgi:hypothetical protein